jgi:hypothetical protein
MRLLGGPRRRLLLAGMALAWLSLVPLLTAGILVAIGLVTG